MTGQYPYTTDITATVFGTADQTVVMLPDFECTIDVEVDLSTGDPVATTTEVYVEGKPLSAGDDLAKRIRTQVMEKADADLAAGNSLWDEVRASQGISYEGRGAGDPDGRWIHA
jgi:hypothetical protein